MLQEDNLKLLSYCSSFMFCYESISIKQYFGYTGLELVMAMLKFLL